MNKLEKENQVKKVLSEVLEKNINEINEDVALNTTYEWDSQAMVSIIVALEEEFDIDIELEDAEKLTSYKAIVEYISTLTN